MDDEKVPLSTPFAVRIDQDDKAWLERERAATGVSVNSMIGKAISTYVKQRKGVRRYRGQS